MKNLFDEDYLGDIPTEGYRIEREDDGHVLFSLDVDGQTRVSFIASDDIEDFNGDQGWGIEAWAVCDLSELPAEVTDDLGIGVWEDASGSRVPLTTIQSQQGPEHCGWQDITFLHLGPLAKGDDYLRDTTGELADLLRTTYAGRRVCPRTPRTQGSIETVGNCGWCRAGKPPMS